MSSFSCPGDSSPSSAYSLWDEMLVDIKEKSRKHHGTGKNKHVTLKASARVDWDGNYLPFPNITIVYPLAPCTSSSATLQEDLQTLPQRLREVAGLYINPVPASAYHVTLMTGPTQVGCKSYDEWKEVLHDRECWTGIADYLHNDPEVEAAAPKLKLDKIAIKSSGGITVYFKDTEEGQNLFSTENDKQVTTETIRMKLRERHEMMERRRRPWHVTLAYPIKTAGEIPPETQDELLEELHRVFKSEEALALRPAALCLSPDMTRFVPWNGDIPATE